MASSILLFYIGYKIGADTWYFILASIYLIQCIFSSQTLIKEKIIIKSGDD